MSTYSNEKLRCSPIMLEQSDTGQHSAQIGKFTISKAYIGKKIVYTCLHSSFNLFKLEIPTHKHN